MHRLYILGFDYMDGFIGGLNPENPKCAHAGLLDHWIEEYRVFEL